MRRSGFILAGLSLILSSAALAQRPAQFTADKGDHPVGPGARSNVDQVAMARGLAVYGIANDMPLTLVAAAGILMKTPATSSTDRPQSGQGKGSAGTSGSGTPVTLGTRQDVQEPELTPEALLLAAKNMVHGDTHLGALIDEMTKQLASGTRSVVGGPMVSYGRVDAGMYHWYNIGFEGGENAHVVIAGDGTGDLDCYAYAEDGSLIDSDTARTDDCVLDWYENWTGKVRIEIVNLGNVYNNYALITN